MEAISSQIGPNFNTSIEFQIKLRVKIKLCKQRAAFWSSFLYENVSELGFEPCYTNFNDNSRTAIRSKCLRQP